MKKSNNDDEFWRVAADEIEAGEEVTVCQGGHVITCSTLEELWEARAEFQHEKEHPPFRELPKPKRRRKP